MQTVLQVAAARSFAPVIERGGLRAEARMQWPSSGCLLTDEAAGAAAAKA